MQWFDVAEIDDFSLKWYKYKGKRRRKKMVVVFLSTFSSFSDNEMLVTRNLSCFRQCFFFLVKFGLFVLCACVYMFVVLGKMT